jgi:hypothetical protein
MSTGYATCDPNVLLEAPPAQPSTQLPSRAHLPCNLTRTLSTHNHRHRHTHTARSHVLRMQLAHYATGQHCSGGTTRLGMPGRNITRLGTHPEAPTSCFPTDSPVLQTSSEDALYQLANGLYAARLIPDLQTAASASHVSSYPRTLYDTIQHVAAGTKQTPSN